MCTRIIENSRYNNLAYLHWQFIAFTESFMRILKICFTLSSLWTRKFWGTILRGALGYTRNRKTEEKFIQNHIKPRTKSAETENRIQNCIHKYGQIAKKYEKPKTTLGTKTEKPLVFFYGIRKPDAKKRKISKPHWTPKPKNRKVFWHKNRKTDQKSIQNRKTENPNAPLHTGSFLELYLGNNSLGSRSCLVNLYPIRS